MIMRTFLFLTIIQLTAAFGELGRAEAKAYVFATNIHVQTHCSHEPETNDFPFQYPRPQMVRVDWQSLNRPWEYAVLHYNKTNSANYEGQIHVPFPIESVLSGVNRQAGLDERLWYRKMFRVPEAWEGRRILLHFGAVDWECAVWVNGKKVGEHQGGYDTFQFDITDVLNPGDQDVVVRVYDGMQGSVKGQVVGKQRRHPTGTYYTGSSGIWQTVWIEPVPEIYIQRMRMSPDLDRSEVNVVITVEGNQTNGIRVELAAFDEGREVGKASGLPGDGIKVAVSNAVTWTPDRPHLYDLEVNLLRGNRVIDSVKSYFAMRKTSAGKDSNNVPRLLLNNRSVFQLGVLDPGCWPDGLYSAPTDQAMREEIETIKKMGFNMCRKHAKVESDRWYYWCDKLGLMVWQDMPSSDLASVGDRPILQNAGASFEHELGRLVEGMGNHPCIVGWVLFNQGWGQFNTVRLTEQLKKLDSTRPVISASGWHDFGCGDVDSRHGYPMPRQTHADGKRVLFFGEFGGLSYPVNGHEIAGKTFAHRLVPDRMAYANEYASLMRQILNLQKSEGLSGAVYTQLTDVEQEVTGLLTYDRAVMRIDPEVISRINKAVIAGEAIPEEINRLIACEPKEGK